MHYLAFSQFLLISLYVWAKSRHLGFLRKVGRLTMEVTAVWVQGVLAIVEKTFADELPLLHFYAVWEFCMT